MATLEEARRRLDWTPEGEHVAVAIWSVEDVRAVVDGDISTEEANAVLDLVDRKQDCEIGISWDVLRVWAETLGFTTHSPSEADEEDDDDDYT